MARISCIEFFPPRMTSYPSHCSSLCIPLKNPRNCNPIFSKRQKTAATMHLKRQNTQQLSAEWHRYQCHRTSEMKGQVSILRKCPKCPLVTRILIKYGPWQIQEVKGLCLGEESGGQLLLAEGQEESGFHCQSQVHASKQQSAILWQKSEHAAQPICQLIRKRLFRSEDQTYPFTPVPIPAFYKEPDSNHFTLCHLYDLRYKC